MDIGLLRQFLDSCQEVKKFTEWFPTLPKGLSQRHMKAVGVIRELSEGGRLVKISDVSQALRGTRPSITRLIQELERDGAVRKTQDAADRRIFRVELTETGEAYYVRYCAEYQTWLASILDCIPPEQFETTIKTIHQVYEILDARWNERNEAYE